MKRAFIRLFGCILSTIGLSMSYDTSFTVLLDNESAPGAAWAAESGSGTGSGCVYTLGTCYPSIPNSFVVAGLTGSCSYKGEKVGYFVVLAPWYVGWLNVDYTGAGGVPYANWPVAEHTVSETVAMDLTFSGTNTYRMSGIFGATMYGTGGNYSSYGAAQEISWCNNSWGLSVGQVYQGVSNTSYLSWRNRCVLNSQEAGSSNRVYDTYIWSAVYMPTSDAFQNMGCCLYASSTGTTGSSGSGTSAGDGCKCYYAQATQAYPYTAYGRTEVGTTNKKISTSTVPFYEPFVFYHYEGCKAGYTPTGTVTGTDANFAVALLREYINNYLELDKDLVGGSVCPSSTAFEEVFDTYPGFVTEDGTTLYSYKWDNCDACPGYTAISNSSSFSPTITSIGTPTYETSDTVNRCNVSVKGVKDASGTFNFTSDCYYDM